VKWLLRGFLLLTLLALGAIGVGYHYGKHLLVPGPKRDVVFEVKPGTTGTDLARSLVAAGLIRDEFSFRMLLRFHPRGRDLRVGFFKLHGSQTPLQLFDELMTATPLSRHATFPEGLIIPQIAAVAKKNALITDERKFMQMCQQDGKSYGDVFPANLEGYLLPDTYEFPWDCKEETVVKRFTDEFKARVLPLWEKRKSKAPLKDLHQTVVLASLVEREAQVDRERGVIAGVYVNRLRLDMRLECDATVQYARGKVKQYLTFEDLKIDSPYNTYMYAGLPPGPIANPGMKSLEAAMSPTPSKYLYYVRNDVKGDGSHAFGKSFAEHEANISRYQR
jgi:UPF0755 protein